MGFRWRPDGPLFLQVADDDPVGVSLADGYLVHADDFRLRRSGEAQLLAHVDFFEFLDRVPVQAHVPGHVLDSHRPAQTADLHGEPQGVLCVVR